MRATHLTAARQAPESVSEKSDAVMVAVNVLLASRRSSFRAWVHAWASATGRDPDASYETARSVMVRSVEVGYEPGGPVGRLLVAAMRSDFGPHVIPPLRHRPRRQPRRAAPGKGVGEK